MTTAAATHNDIVAVFGRRVAYKWVVAIVYVSALFIDILDTTIVNVAIPALGRELRTQNAEWVVLGYTLSLAVWIPASGWLGDRFGTKRTFLTALAAFTVGSALCGLAQTIGQLIAFRVVQGVGGGMLTPVGVAMLFRAFPPRERARASTIVMVPLMFAPALGPVLGGLITTTLNWRWIFWVNVPIGLAALWFGATNLREHREPATGPFDGAGFVLSGAALALLVYALAEGPRGGWTSRAVVLSTVVGSVSLLAMVVVETRIAHPMLALRLFGDDMFRRCSLINFLSVASFLGSTFVLPIYLQLVRGLTPLASGLTTFPQAIGVMVSSVIAGRLYPRVGPRRLMVVAFIVSGLALVPFTVIGAGTSQWFIRAVLLVRGFFAGFAFVPMQAASYATIAPADNGRASSIFSTLRQVGVSVGVAVLASVLAAHMSLNSRPVGAEVARALTGVRWAFAVSIGFAMLAAAYASFVRDDQALATMRHRH